MRVLSQLFWFLLVIILISFIIIFVSTNKNLVIISIWPFKNSLSLEIWSVIFFSFTMGLILGVFLCTFSIIKLRATIWKNKKTVKKLTLKLSNIENKNLDD